MKNEAISRFIHSILENYGLTKEIFYRQLAGKTELSYYQIRQKANISTVEFSKTWFSPNHLSPIIETLSEMAGLQFEEVEAMAKIHEINERIARITRRWVAGKISAERAMKLIYQIQSEVNP